ncbi:MAG: hypothetical protein V1645_04825 [archaeon]
MKKEIIDSLVKTGILRVRQLDRERVKSLIKSAKTNADVVREITLNDDTATVIFREIYESIRQLGDAQWWLLGYEPSNHEISLEILKEIDIREKVKLNFLSRFKQIRHDANYKGFRVSASQAREIVDFWDKCGGDVIKVLSKQLNNN